ncbi:hypothetical protein [Clostridium tertium]|uniref:hypothetical protein n=1 Tax=Clostridium tertium TaxID=1559 RepID=UPI0024B36F28|nr:hypothetical protein [Clostridium tertium]MDI9217141.1 hypothetical protein [Clostridium tertium]
MKDIAKYRSLKNVAWLLIPALLGIYQSKVNTIQNVIKYSNESNINELANSIIADTVFLEIFGYLIFFLAMVIYFKCKFLRDTSKG